MKKKGCACTLHKRISRIERMKIPGRDKTFMKNIAYEVTLAQDDATYWEMKYRGTWPTHKKA